MPNTGANASPGRYRWLGLLGSLALAAGALTAGARPAADTGPSLRSSGGAGTVLVFAGLVVLTAAWLLIGRSVEGQPPPGERWLYVTLAWWAAPLLLVPPLFSRDVYSYLAQGAMLAHGLDVYTHGPADLGGPTAVQIPQVWQHTPAPYGPAFLLVARAAAPLADHPWAGTLALRLAAACAVAVMAALVPALARTLGADPVGALRLGVLNPLVLVHLIAGAHNDALAFVLLLGGLLAATRGRALLAAVLVALAVLVKAPAVLALPVVCLIAIADRARRAQLLKAVRALATVGATVLAVGATVLAVGVTVLAVTAVAGTGYGWIGALTTPATSTSWSLTTSLGRLAADLTGTAPDGAIAATRLLGLAFVAVAICVLAWRVVRRGSEPVAALALAFAVLVALGPAFRPWYALWAVLPAAFAVRAPGVRRVVEITCAVLVFVVMPDGFGPDGAELVLAVGGLVIGAVVVLVTERGVPFRERQLAC
ncbi:polyprenol phosphomannose-dependent alpha 1,6 mannosyltransferase MptB [Kitasatospora sp. NPDC059673]|uniref:polyprenol phosphomannose-dependent alpha 1,6 mannosyltransferase MptB n=1 Tax=Kitasatospora sp. NPDC059673 TaxID=3346901 RepID=UPI003678CAAA